MKKMNKYNVLYVTEFYEKLMVNTYIQLLLKNISNSSALTYTEK